MDKIVRREFTGSWLLFWALCLSGVGLPIALIYLLDRTVEVHTEVKEAEAALDKIRAKL